MMNDTGPAPVRYYIHTDQLGTPQKITDGAANVVWDGQFDPFGNIIPISITATTGGTNWGTGVLGEFQLGADAGDSGRCCRHGLQ